MKIVLIKEQNKKRRSIDLIAGHHEQGRQENIWAPVQKKLAPPSSNSPNNDTQTKSTTVCHKQGISTTKMN
jgi:hypothetical protein